VEVLALGAWLVIAAVGAVASLWNLLDARRDRAALDSAVQNGRRLIANGWVQDEAIRLVKQLLALAIGFAPLFGLSGLITFGLLTIAALTTLLSVLGYARRRALNRGLGVKR
jgi:hypothetical protein